jgi:hypothetical protein
VAVLPAGEPVTVTRPSWVTDRYGNEAADWDATTVTTYDPCVAYPGTSEETTDGRVSGTMAELTLLLPYGADVQPSDRVTWRGRSFEVISQSYDWRSPLTGWQPGTQVDLRAYDG